MYTAAAPPAQTAGAALLAAFITHASLMVLESFFSTLTARAQPLAWLSGLCARTLASSEITVTVWWDVCSAWFRQWDSDNAPPYYDGRNIYYYNSTREGAPRADRPPNTQTATFWGFLYGVQCVVVCPQRGLGWW